MNAHESEHVSENESEVVLAIVLGYVGGVDPGCCDVDARGCAFHLHVYVHGCVRHHREHADGNV